MQAHDTPLALIGYSSRAAAAFRAAGLLALSLEGDDLGTTLASCHQLRFLGALIHPLLEGEALEHVTPEEDAQTSRQVSAVAFSRQSGKPGRHGIHAQDAALTDAVQASGFQPLGATMLLLGSGPDLVQGLPLARLGFHSVGIATEHLSDAERYTRELPRQVHSFALSRLDSSLVSLAHRSDLLVLTGGTLPGELVQPYHTVLDLSGQLGAQREAARLGATLLSLPDLATLRLARQLLHATGQRYAPEDLKALAQALAAEEAART